MADKKLKPEVSAVYELAPDTPIVGGFASFGRIDLSELDLETANNLVGNGFKGLILKQTEPKAKK